MVALIEIAAGPFVALIGIVAVFFVMRHRSVQTKSMYSARRGQIERKVRAARQRTLTPASKHAEKEAEAQGEQTFAAPGMEAKTSAPTATWGPPAAGPAPAPPPPAPAETTWDAGPTVAPPPAPSPSPFAPSAPAYTPPPPAPEEEWVPAAVQPVERRPEPIEPPVSTPAGAGAAWSIVGDSKAGTGEPESGKKKTKKDKERERQAEGAPWQLSTGLMPGDEAGEEIKRPSAAIAIAQYAVLVVGLVMVLIGVVVMVANSHVT
ncbi:MAG TPA: hypothetical protein DCF65_04935 [Chloroflexi bacterium]|jgi:uncharacterized membrane protein|nr:hypothetical protein [Chloroflexota bacterium]